MEGSQVYIPDEKLAWVPGTVLRTEDGGKRVLVRLVHANATTIDDRWVDLRDESMPSELPLQNDDPLVHGSVNDMCTLNHLHEPAIVYNLRARFLQQRPYTYTGDIVVAVNPYAWLDGLYSKATQALYMGKDRRSSLPPHVYATSASAFTSMIQYDRHQSILVSGESGAGKTETVKILMEHLATMSTTTQGQSSNLAVVAKVLKSNPLLEAFGNAKTIRNDNSSRFGKFTQLQFDHEHQLVGAKCRHYLLEKSRVVTQSDPHERNYHIFYQLVASNDPRWNLLQNQPNQNQHATSFAYLQGDRSLSSSSFSLDATRYTATREALTTIGMPQLDQLALLDALAGILHVGQVSFTPRNSDDGSSNADMTSDAWTMTYTLLGLDPRSLATSLCNRTVKARLEVYVVPLSIDQAQMNRDAMAKEIYARLFGYLVQCVNESISNDNAMVTHIDLLDIFGFEAFATNRFEQFCINFANEKLQQKFTHDVFKTVQEEYEQEGLGWTYVQFKDNQDLLDLLEAPLGVISLLNEECIRPMGNDLTFCSKLTSTHDVHPRLDKQKARLSASHFALKHYAGTVMYCVDGFVETNKDALSTEVVSLLATSSNHLVSHVFQDVTTSSSAHRSSRRGSISSGFMGETVVSKFKTQLAGLMADIAATQVHYVRCIKPNAVKSSSAFDFRDVADQLRCAGVVEAIRISRAAFPNKLSHERFLHRFELLQNAKIKAANVVTVGAACAQLATALIGQPESPTSFVLGSLHIFFAAGVLEELETQRMDRMHSRATLLQRMVRGLLCRRWFLRQRTAAVLIQARFRQYTTTTKFQQTRRRVTRLQALWRGRASRRSLATRQFTLSVVLVQRNYRKYIAKKEYIKFRQAVILLQAQAKQRTQQAKFHAHKRELRAQQTMEMDIVALKTRLDEEKRRALDEHKQQGAMGISLLPTTKQILPPPPPPPSAGMFAAGLSVDDVSLLDESGRMLETLQREVQKWRDVHDRDISEMDQLKNENKRIKDAYTAAGASFAALNQHNKQQSKANLRLMSTHAALIKSQEEKMKKYQRQVADLKDELKLVKGSNGFAVGAASVQENVLQVLTDHHVHHDVQAKVRQVFEGSSSVHHAPQRRTSVTPSTYEPSVVATQRRGPMPGTSIDQQKRPSSNLHSNGSTADNLRGSGVLPKEDGGQLLSNNSIYYEEDANRKSGLGGMLKKMFKKNDN